MALEPNRVTFSGRKNEWDQYVIVRYDQGQRVAESFHDDLDDAQETYPLILAEAQRDWAVGRYMKPLKKQRR